jgi:hypothetical protein
MLVDHRRVEAHPSPLHRFFGAGDIYDAVWICAIAAGPRAKPHRPIVLASGTLPPSTRVKSRYTRLARHLPFQNLVAPVADMLQHQKAQNHLGRRAGTAVRRALRMPCARAPYTVATR